MLHINSTSQDTMESLIDTYKLPASVPNGTSEISTLSKYVFERCSHLIPYEIRHF